MKNRSELLALPADQRLQLVEAIWDSLIEDPEAVPITDEVREELDRRFGRLLRRSFLCSPVARNSGRVARYEVTRDIVVTREAQADIAEAVAGFRDISPALSARFGVELERIYSTIAEYPELYPAVYKSFRRGLLRKFPYSVSMLSKNHSSLLLASSIRHVTNQHGRDARSAGKESQGGRAVFVAGPCASSLNGDLKFAPP